MANIIKWFTTTKLGRATGIFMLSGAIGLATFYGVPGTEYLQQALEFIKASAVALPAAV